MVSKLNADNIQHLEILANLNLTILVAFCQLLTQLRVVRPVNSCFSGAGACRGLTCHVSYCLLKDI